MVEDGWIGRWKPGIGDPTIGGWVTVAGYALAAVLCVVTLLSLRALKDDQKRFGRESALWTILAIALALLGINKQLDLQSAMTEAFRILAKEGGWYQDRGAYQALFILGLGIVAFIAIIGLVFLVRGLGNWTKLAAAGLVLIIGFVLARAASFHHFDRLIGSRLLGLKINWILELGGISIVALGAVMRRRSPLPASSSKAED